MWEKHVKLSSCFDQTNQQMPSSVSVLALRNGKFIFERGKIVEIQLNKYYHLHGV